MNTTINTNLEIFSKEFFNLSENKSKWYGFLQNELISDAPKELETIMSSIREFLLPIILAIENGIQFDAKWSPAGNWNY